MNILVTNNPLVQARYQNAYSVKMLDTDLQGVLTVVRDLTHKGHCLLTHPLSGSIKPNDSPYKSVLMSDTRGDADTQSISIIEECILTMQKFPVKIIHEQNLYDLQMIDLTLIDSALK